MIDSPYKIGQEGARGDDLVKLDGLKKVHHQVNDTNILLQPIAEQLNHVSTKIDSQKSKIGIGEASQSAYNFADNISKPFFKVDSILQQNKKSLC